MFLKDTQRTLTGAGAFQTLNKTVLRMLTLSCESKPGQVGLERQWESFAVNDLPLFTTKLQQLHPQSLFPIKTSSW